MKVFCPVFLGLFLITCTATKIAKSLPAETAKEELLQLILAVSVDYQWYSAKAKVYIETPELQGGGRMNIRMIKDSLIWFNFKKMSIEGARGLVTPNEFTLIYRQEKRYEQGKFHELLENYQLPLSFDELQFYISGNLPKPTKQTLQYEKKGNSHHLFGKNDLYQLLYIFDEFLDLKSLRIKDSENRMLWIEFRNKDEERGIYMGRKLLFPYNQNKGGKLEINLSNIEIDVPKNIPFSVPSHYTRF